MCVSKCASLCLGEIQTARGTVLPGFCGSELQAVGHSWDHQGLFGISSLLPSPALLPMGLQERRGQPGRRKEQGAFH